MGCKRAVIVLPNSISIRFDNTDGHMGISPITGVEIPHEKGMYTKKMYGFIGLL